MYNIKVMSGHSHYATIHRQKEKEDAKRGQVFSKLSKAISLAVKAGGGPDPSSNYKLRMAIDQAKMANMPKDNVERAIQRASKEADNIEEVTYEGYAPFGVAVIVEVATNNRNRTAQEIKNLFDRGGGSLGGPGSVAFNFDSKGLIVTKVGEDKDTQMLEMIDVGVEEINEVDGELEAYTNPSETAEVKEKLQEKGFEIVSSSLVKKAKTMINITEKGKAEKLIKFLEKLDELDDVQNVYANFDVSDEALVTLEN